MNCRKKPEKIEESMSTILQFQVLVSLKKETPKIPAPCLMQFLQPIVSQRDEVILTMA